MLIDFCKELDPIGSFQLKDFLLILIARLYLRYVKVMDMISKRLTKDQKDEIVEAYRCGENSNTLAKKYSCSSNTINRTVKTLLSDIEYQVLKGKRLKSSKKKSELIFNEIEDEKQKDIPFDSSQEKVNRKEKTKKNNNEMQNSKSDEIAVLPIGDFSTFEDKNYEPSNDEKENQISGNQFAEIVPLVSNFNLETKNLDFQILNQEILPESVFMLVDKKVELEVKPLYDLPEWSFLPENELKRNAIQLFSNQRTAKRICSKNQRVIKIPNTNIFEVTKPYLLSKGITRLILEDSIISLDD